MHFTYREGTLPPHELSQGDVLRRTPALEKLLKQYYPYFGDNEENQFFLVITQSCDLVPRNGGVCKAKYIELAAVRPLSVAVQRELAKQTLPEFELPFPVGGLKARDKFTQFLERLFNNNEEEYFFLQRESTAGLPEDYCAFLHLTVPIKAEHYSDCLAARILALNTVFQAKLGWKVGQIYARVGTDDWPRPALQTRIKEITKNTGTLWLDEKMLKPTLEGVRKQKVEEPEAALTAAGVKRLVSKLPTKKALVLAQLKKLLLESAVVSAAGPLTDEDVDKLIKHIRQDQLFGSYLS